MPRNDGPGLTTPASATRSRRTWTPRLVPAALAALLVIALLVAFAASPYLFAGATLRSEIAAQLRATTGLVLTTRSHARFALLPRPHVTMTALHIADPSGTLTIDADAIDGDVRLLPLLFGHLELSSATLTRPRLAIDLDGRPMQPDSTIGRALHAPADSGGSGRLGTVTLVDGSAVLKSQLRRDLPTFEHIGVTIDWRDLESPATLTGSIAFGGTTADVAAWVSQPASYMRGEPSAIALQIHSAPLELSANGTLAGMEPVGFKGNVSASSPSLPALAALGGTHLAPLAPFADLRLGGDATVAFGKGSPLTLDLASLRLRLDGNEYEGTLSFHRGASAALSGTLATDRLSLAPFLDRLPRIVDARRQWSSERLMLDGGDPVDLDLRISATHLLAAPFTIDDGALAVMTRNGRTEVALVDGKAYGGAAKARLSVAVSPAGLSVRGTGSLTDAEAASLSWDGFGRQIAGGTLSAFCSIETSGDSPAALMAHLQGWARGHLNDGEISGIDLARGLRSAQESTIAAALPTMRSGRTPFATISSGVRIADGIAVVDDATLTGPGAAMTLAGKADIGRRDLDLRATASIPGAPGASATNPVRLDVTGSFDRVVVSPVTGAGKP